MTHLTTQQGPVNGERLSYVMLFCALLMVRNSRATLEQAVGIVPLVPNVKHLAAELAR